ncbi:hypothetical protein SLE2022_197000 [Rubroshorea leprosula]
MSDEGERTCPLCAEEMDLTDQQLKPCKCGYEICVWCWHHIMDMAEKDDTEGRCPACRVPYDKEKIEGMAANCERLVAEINLERKMKSQKAKTKSSEGRKQLSSVRVIQRNLVYIVGLPLNLADEDLLQHREYFGQYGKVLKVSMSRTAAGVIQQFPNNTCSVYITYSKEEEAIRCIQSVHGFVLEGRSLKACFGTTKYCHAWLRNVPCTNPDCLYLHEIGSQEDSFTKDEIISAYTRSRVQQLTSATNNMQWRSGSVLPPPVDDYCQNSTASTARPIAKNAPNNTAVGITKDSPPNGSSGRSIGLPAGASWGMRASNQLPVAGLACSNGPSKQKSDTTSGTLAFSSAVASTTPVSTLHSDTIHMKGKPDLLKPLKQNAGLDCRTTSLEKPAAPDVSPANKPLSSQLSFPLQSKYDDQVTGIPSSVVSPSFDPTVRSCVSAAEKEGNITMDGKLQSLSSDMSSLNIDRNVSNEHSGMIRPSSSDSDQGLTKPPGNLGLQQCYAERYRESSSSPATGRSLTTLTGMSIPRDLHDWRTDSQTQAVMNSSSEVEEDILSFDNQRLKDPEVSRSTYVSNSSSPFLSNHTRSHSLQHNEPFNVVNLNADNIFIDNKLGDNLLLHGSSSSMSNGYPEKFLSSSVDFDVSGEGSLFLSNELKGKQMGRFFGNVDSNAAKDKGESSIISNIFSLDFETWDEPLTSPQNLAKLLGDTDEPTALKLSSSWKVQNNNQSRFSFARQEDSKYQSFDVDPSLSVHGQMTKTSSFSQDFAESRDPYLDKFGVCNGFSTNNFDESNNFAGSSSVFSSNKLSAISRAQISAPPGFAVPSRAPPPGFSSHERVEQSFDSIPGNYLLDSSSLLRNSFQAPPSGNIGTAGEIEFFDPAILAVGKGRHQGGLNNTGLDLRSNFPSPLSAFENEARRQLFMQRSFNTQQNLRYADIGDSFSSLNDSYGISSRLLDQAQVNNVPPFAQLSLQQTRNSRMSNGHWDSWNEVQGGNNVAMAELLRNERLGFNKFYAGYDDSKFRMASSGDLYNRTFGM